MENKTYEIGGQKFTMNPTQLEVKKSGIKLIARLKKLQDEYLGGIDFSLIEGLEVKKQPLEIAKKQVEEILEKEPEKQSEYAEQLETLNKGIEAINLELDGFEIKRQLQLRNELNSLAMADLIVDVDFLRPILGKIFKADFSKIELTTAFVSEVIVDFFSLMSTSLMK